MDPILAQVFEAVLQAVREKQPDFNQADTQNHNHGDHMVEIFQLAVATLSELKQESLSESMLRTGLVLRKLEGNGLARVYGDGLIAFAQKLEQRGISQAELIRFVREKTGHTRLEQTKGNEQIVEEKGIHDDRSGQVLKALVEGLSAWKQMDKGLSAKGRNLDMGALFELGIIYLQAKQRGGSNIEVLADAAVSASPLNQSAHRKLSGMIVIQAMLEALATYESGDSIT
jgi:hypothetical protein